MKSMTGYGNKKWQTSDLSVEVVIRAVNGRFFEPRFHLPREYFFMESDLKKSLNQKVQRGTVDIFLFRKLNTHGRSQKVLVNESLANKIYASYQGLSRKLQIPLQHPMELILKNPEVVRIDDNSEVSAQEKKAVHQIFIEAVKSLDQERAREGEALKKHLLNLVKNLGQQLNEISKQREKANHLLKEKYDLKFKTRTQGLEVDQQRWAQEVMIYLDKSDINEELQRLSEHLSHLTTLLKSSHAEGKKLDFYTQELLREMNTIGSKSQLASITQFVVEAKTSIEKIKEQVQNVE